MTEVVVALILLVGSGLMLLAAVGVLRLPDVYARLQAGTKAASLGLALVFVATAIATEGTTAAVKLVLAIVFQFATAPVAAHVIGRAAYLSGAPMWEGTVVDELAPTVPSRARRAAAPPSGSGSPPLGGHEDADPPTRR